METFINSLAVGVCSGYSGYHRGHDEQASPSDKTSTRQQDASNTTQADSSERRSATRWCQ